LAVEAGAPSIIARTFQFGSSPFAVGQEHVVGKEVAQGQAHAIAILAAKHDEVRFTEGARAGHHTPGQKVLRP
jgi:hypothetical protein